MYRCQACKKTFEEFDVLGQCPHCSHLSKVACPCGHKGEGWEFVKNDDSCPACGRKMKVVGGASEHNRPAPKKPIWLFVVLGVLLVLAVLGVITAMVVLG